MDDLVKIENFKKFLNELQIKIKEATNRTSSKMEEIQKLGAKPYDRAMYDKFFDNVLVNDSNETRYISQLTETKEKIDDIIDVINSSLLQRNEFKQVINNHQIRSGLTGLSKQNISDTKSESEISQYPEYIQDLVRGKFVDTPHKKQGGKLTRKNRKKQIKSKKRRSLYK
jgi:hypothetical protein